MITEEQGIDFAIIEQVKLQFANIGCAQLNDASQKFTVPFPTKFQNRTKHLKLCGPVYTVNTDNDMLPGLEALSKAPKGSILFLNNVNETSEALAGDIYVLEAIRRELGGLVINGAVRDIDDLNKLDFPVFSTEITYVSAKTAVTPATKVPDIVQIDNITIEPQDWIFGDNDGLLLIKRKYLNAVLQGALYVEQREQELKNEILSGKSMASLTGLDDYLAGKGPLKFDV
ncbi:RraA family protein [Paenibacillus taichungensis]|uniref:RraA family protein n=1 Tax=Paenibacillus taichungensis TaxID=484184 RepID=UPI002DBEF773|nr:RraA family protein [Paenibacillus taichungensis]MEC0106294.1 RraA family protein [Paenibacillus taichungensis]MEC0200196.1 RraA family protein [Paenibacillus taichungensis]